MTTSIDADPMTASFFLFERQDTGQALTEALDDHDVLRPGRRGAAGDPDRPARRPRTRSASSPTDCSTWTWATWWSPAGASRSGSPPRPSAPPPTPAARSGSSWPPTASARSTDPSVELLLDDTHLTDVNFELDVEFVIKALEATVREGRVVSLHAGECDVSATLAAEGIRLAGRQRTYELPLVVRWPLLLHLGGDAGPPPYGAKPRPRRRPSEVRGPSASPTKGRAASGRSRARRPISGRDAGI